MGDDDDIWHPARIDIFNQLATEAPPRVTCIRFEKTCASGGSDIMCVEDVHTALADKRAMIETCKEYFLSAVRLRVLRDFLKKAKPGLIDSKYCDMAFRGFLTGYESALGGCTMSIDMETWEDAPTWLYFYRSGHDSVRSRRLAPDNDMLAAYVGRVERLAKDKGMDALIHIMQCCEGGLSGLIPRIENNVELGMATCAFNKCPEDDVINCMVSGASTWSNQDGLADVILAVMFLSGAHGIIMNRVWQNDCYSLKKKMDEHGEAVLSRVARYTLRDGEVCRNDAK